MRRRGRVGLVAHEGVGKCWTVEEVIEGSWMEVGLDQGVGWDSLSSGRRGDRTSGLCQQSGTMCMAWDIGEAEGI